MLGNGNFRRNNTTQQSYLKIIIIIFLFYFRKQKQKNQNELFRQTKRGCGLRVIYRIEVSRLFQLCCSSLLLIFFQESFTGASAKFCRCSCEHICDLRLDFFNTSIYKVKRHHGTSIRLYLVCIYVPLYINIKCA